MASLKEQSGGSLGKGLDFSGIRVGCDLQASSVVTISAFVRSDDLLSAHPRIVNMPDYYLYFSTRGVASIPDGNANTLGSIRIATWNSECGIPFRMQLLKVNGCTCSLIMTVGNY